MKELVLNSPESITVFTNGQPLFSSRLVPHRGGASTGNMDLAVSQAKVHVVPQLDVFVDTSCAVWWEAVHRPRPVLTTGVKAHSSSVIIQLSISGHMEAPVRQTRDRDVQLRGPGTLCEALSEKVMVAGGSPAALED